MKIEMFEKVGEITIAELRPASLNNSIATAEAERKAEIARIEAERKEREEKEQAVKVLTLLVEEINKTAETGATMLALDWTEKRPASHGIRWNDWLHLSKYFKPILESAGYTFCVHWYSDSWTRRSGKIGYAYIYWHKV